MFGPFRALNKPPVTQIVFLLVYDPGNLHFGNLNKNIVGTPSWTEVDRASELTHTHRRCLKPDTFTESCGDLGPVIWSNSE